MAPTVKKEEWHGKLGFCPVTKETCRIDCMWYRIKIEHIANKVHKTPECAVRGLLYK